MAKKKSSSKKQNNLLFTVIGILVAALVIATLAFNVFHKITFENLLVAEGHYYTTGAKYIGGLFGENGYTAFVDIAGVISYMLVLLGALSYIVFAVLKVAGFKINQKLVKLVAYFTVLFGIVFAVMAFISAGNATATLVTPLTKEPIGKVVASLSVYLAVFGTIGNAVIATLDK